MTEERVLDTSEGQVPEQKKKGGRRHTAPTASEAAVPSAPPKPEKRNVGRPKIIVAPPPAVEVGTEQLVELSAIDLDDTSFRFRVKLRTGDLEESIHLEGQQLPVLLRRVPGKEKLQLISGFRRTKALQNLGQTKVKGIIRTDLTDDAKAFRVSILENEERATYNDLDRAHAILAYRGMGRSNAEIEDIFRIGSRQRQRLEALTTFPDVLKQAIDDKVVDSTKAVRLMQHARQHVQKDFSLEEGWSKTTVAWVEKWLEWITTEKASLENLIKALKEELADEKHEQPIEFCVPQEKDGRKSLRIRPIAIDDSLTEAQREQLIKDLESTIKFVGGLKKKTVKS